MTRAESHVAASPAAVWAVLGDVRRMPDLSPELVRMIGLKPGGPRRGQWYLGTNRRSWVVVADSEHGHRRRTGETGGLGHSDDLERDSAVGARLKEAVEGARPRRDLL